MSQSNVVYAAGLGVTRDSLFASAAEISHDLSLHAADLDRDGRPPIGEIVKLKKAGLLNALHAREIGGGGLDWVDGLKLVRILARGESSIGQLLGYHYVNSQSIYWSFADQARAQVLGAETVSQNLYWGAAVNPRDPGLTLTRRGTGYVLNGRKSFSTAARVSDYINANATLEGKIANFAVPTDRPGYVANDDWDNIGQRLSDSGSVEFHDFPVYEEDFIAPPADENVPPPGTGDIQYAADPAGFRQFLSGCRRRGAGRCCRLHPHHHPSLGDVRRRARGRRPLYSRTCRRIYRSAKSVCCACRQCRPRGADVACEGA